MDLILIAGLWLDGSSWDHVVPVLEQAGHRAHALTLPGMESRDAARSGITLRDHVDAVVAQIDALTEGGGQVALVAHSRGGAVAHAAVDARPGAVARVVYVAGEPVPDGWPGPEHFRGVGGEVPLPDPSFFDEGELDDLDEASLAALYGRAIPSPEHVVHDAQRLGDDVDLPTGHWPQFTRPADLGRAIVAALD
jgi:pimeloyl-ACP methyl ester carboxylesterase